MSDQSAKMLSVQFTSVKRFHNSKRNLTDLFRNCPAYPFVPLISFTIRLLRSSIIIKFLQILNKNILHGLITLTKFAALLSATTASDASTKESPVMSAATYPVINAATALSILERSDASITPS